MSRFARAAGLVSVATFCSRVFGLLRDAVRASLLGARWLSDAVNVAFKVPNLFRDLFAEGAFSGAFVPTISQVRADEGDAAALELLSRVLSTMLIYVGALVALAMLFAPQVVSAIASPTFVHESGYYDLAVFLVRLLSPFLLFICFAVACMGALNVFGRFFLPALSPAMQNVLLVAGGLLFYRIGLGKTAAAIPWAILLLGGGALQFLIQVPPLLRAGWHPRFRPDLALKNPATRQILRRMLPVAGGLAATQVCILINTRLATAFEGGTSNLYYAFRLVHLPVGLVGVAVGTVVLAEASRRAARKDMAGLRATLSEALMLDLAFAVPACAGLLVLGPPIAKLLFWWGGMEEAGVLAIGSTIRYYALAVIFYCSVKVVVPVFYAQGRVKVPLAASLAAVGANLACALSLTPYLQYRGLALAVGLGQAANLAVLLGVLARDHGAPGGEALLRLLKVMAASVLCGFAAWIALLWFPDRPEAGVRLARVAIPVLCGGGVYFGAGYLLRCPEIFGLLRGLRSLDRKRRGA